MKKTVRTIAFYLFAVVLAVFCLFTVSAESFLSARAAESIGYDGTNVLDDLEGVTIDGEPFNLSDYAPNAYTKTDVILFSEYCYGYYTTMRSAYGLYVYVWNPQLIGYDLRSELNQIQFTTTQGGSYAKYPLEYLNMSNEPGYEGVLYKFKVVLTSAQRDEIFASFSGASERYYHVSGIELLINGELNATEYNVNKEYIYSGYAADYGPDAEAESTLTFRQEEGTTLELDVHSTTYRPEGFNSINEHTQDSLHSVYFAVPNDTLEEFGELTAVHAQWRNAILAPTLVIRQSDLEMEYMEQQLEAYLGQNIGQYRDDPYSWYTFAFGDALHTYVGDGLDDAYVFYYNLDTNSSAKLYTDSLFDVTGTRIDTYEEYSSAAFGKRNNYYDHRTEMTDDIYLDAINMYMALDTNDLSDYVVPSGTTKARMLELSRGVYADSEKVNGKYAVNLFSEVADEITEVEIKNSDTFSLTNSEWKDGWDLFWANLSFGTVSKYNTDFEELEAIHAVQPFDMMGGEDEICNRLKIGKSEYQDFTDFYESHKDNYTVYLFRYQQSNYEAIEGDIYKRNADSKSHWEWQNTQCYIFQETVNLDFDIIDVSFTDENLKTTVVPVIANPIDVIPEPTPPIGMEDNVPWLTIALLLACSVAGVIITTIIERSAKKAPKSRTGGSSSGGRKRSTTRRTTKRKTTTKQSKR